MLYISPLKALDNDVHRNLEAPRAGIRAALGPAGETLSIESAVRTGDTPARLRAAQLRRPPDLLITTPETLYILLTSAARRILSHVETVILDEIHSVAGTKRGSHLALSLERLDALVARSGGARPVRIALSATVEPVAEVADFVGGVSHAVTPVVIDARKSLDLTVTAPAPDFKDLPDGSAWGPAVETMAQEIGKRRTTLVFCNNRRLAERVAAKLEERLLRHVPTHHGSISRVRREELERQLKAGELPVLTATGSLELGLDVGHVDAVIQVESPKGVGRGLQRVGRSGHLVGETARGLFVPLFSDDLFECAATVAGMRDGAVEATRPPRFPLDVLAQQLVAETVAVGDGAGVTAAELYDLFRGAAPYRDLPRTLFNETLAMLSGKYPKERFAELAAKLVWDRATDRVTALPGARLAALLDGGTIGDRGTFKAVLRDRKTVVGDLDEEFVYETREGDVFLLGSRAWRALEISHDRVVVEDATGQPARMPFWRGEGLGRSADLGERIGRLKRFIAEGLDDPDLPAALGARYAVTPDAAAAMTGSVRREAIESGGVSSDRTVLFEAFPNDLGDPCVVVRSVFGRGVNLPWSLVLATVLREETGVEVETIASDDGILLRTPRAERELPLARLARIGSAEAKERLLAHLPNTPMFGARFRENAQRALLLPRARNGRRTPFWLQRLKAKDLLQTTRTLPDFPIVAETYRDCLRDLWAYDRLLRLLDDLASGATNALLVRRRFPSPAASSLLFRFIAVYMYEWDAPKAEKEIHAIAANRALLGEVLGEGADDGLRPEAVEEARAEASRLVPFRLARTAEELLLAFQELGDLTPDEALERCAGNGAAWLSDLGTRGSIVETTVGGGSRLVAAEERARWEALAAGTLDVEELDALVLRLVATRGPLPPAHVAARLGASPPDVESSLERLRLEALVVHGRFGQPGGPVRYAGARLAEAIRRRTLTILRREVRPVPVATYRAHLAERQGVTVGSRFTGAHAAERALGLLRGLPLPALAWETALLPARLAEPEPDALDVLSARGLLVWRADGVKDPRAARLSFFFRGEGRVVLPIEPPDLAPLSGGARRVHEALAVHGASFGPDLAASLRLDDGELRAALGELVLAGLVIGDGLHGLRQILRAGRREPVKAQPPAREALGRHPGRGALREAERRVSARLGLHWPGAPLEARPLEGRWSVLLSAGVLGGDARADERAEAWARILLARWGVVSREVVEREGAVRWSEVAPVLARLEMRGDLRRGEFVAGHGPMQYAEAETVETLRERAADREGEPALSVVGGADPVLVGLEPAPARDAWVALAGGEVLLRLDPDGALTAPGDTGDVPARRAVTELQSLLRRGRDPLARPRRLVVATVNGLPAAGSPIAPLLESLGFVRDDARYTWRAV